MWDQKNILLIVSGGVAAYKSLETARLLRGLGCKMRCVLTRGGANFVTPLSLAALSGEIVYQDMFSLTDENEMGHIRLAREADLILIVPATANILARMASGIADDLATTILLAADGPIMVAPAMNTRMWEHPATKANIATLESRGVHLIGPEAGDLACGEIGLGRMTEPQDIVDAIGGFFKRSNVLAGRRALVTSGPTHEAIDPVRYIANHSSGKQGHAIANALAMMGAETILVSGPTNQPDPAGVTVLHVESATQMLAACEGALPVDMAVCAAAVADWRPVIAASSKMKKNGTFSALELCENPDILATLCAAGNRRPQLVVGFAAETEQVIENARTKRNSKGCDWIVANDVSANQGTFGGDNNTIHLVSENGDVESWPTLSKIAVAHRLVQRMADALGRTS